MRAHTRMNDDDYDDMFGEDSDNEHDEPPDHHSKDNISSNTEILSTDDVNEDYDDMFGEESSDDDDNNDDDDSVQVIHVDSSSLRVPRKNKHHHSNSTAAAAGTSRSRAISGKDAAQSTTCTRKRQRSTAPPCAATRIMIRKKEPNDYQSFTMDDYWRSLRSWDFVLELNAQMKRNHPKQPLASFSQNGVQPLPDDFDCVQEYVALWAPLQLKETKAQILAHVISNRTVSFQNITQPMQATPKRMSDSYSEHLTLDIVSRNENHGHVTGNSSGHANTNGSGSGDSNVFRKRSNVSVGSSGGGGGGQIEFMQNDLVLITCDSSIVEQAYKGTLRPPDRKSSYSMSSLLSMASPFIEGRLAIVGVVNGRCKGLDGLVVNVSKRLWKDASLGARDLCLLKLGTNVTGELCGMFVE